MKGRWCWFLYFLGVLWLIENLWGLLYCIVVWRIVCYFCFFYYFEDWDEGVGRVRGGDV